MIEVKHLTKRYGNHTAVNDLSFTIEKGQIYGFLGPNGAGKSTTMNIMTGCLAASSGEVKIGGYDIFEQAPEAKRLIGYLPEQPPLYMDRTPREYLQFVTEAKGIPASQRGQQIEYALKVTQTTDVADRLIRHLSKGYKQRIGIAQALLGDPEIIILDEPTVGLDPRQIIEIRDLITELGKKHTVILSSHILSEVQAVCQTILIISKGQLVACDTPANLERLFAGTTSVELKAEATEQEVRRILAGVPHISKLTIRPERIEENRSDGKGTSGKGPNEREANERGSACCQVRIDTEQDLGENICRDIFFAFAGAGKAILSMSMAKASLEDIFIELTSKEAQTAERPSGKRSFGWKPGKSRTDKASQQQLEETKEELGAEKLEEEEEEQ